MPWLRPAPVLLLAASLLACVSSEAERTAEVPARVFAAASLSDLVADLDSHLRARGGAGLEASFAGSNTLERQILAGAPADLFLSAHRAPAQRLVAAGLASASAVEEVFGNRLVVVAPADRDPQPLESPAGLLRFERLAVADPEGVPAGLYARAWLESEGLWQNLAERAVPAADVRAALASVAGGHLEAGIVYASDAASEPRVRVLLRVPPGRSEEVRYLAVPLAGREDRAAPVLALLDSPQGRRILREQGFLALKPSPEVAAGEGGS